ncbi:VanZ family protein [Candidatus Azambacteria bacterium]|nr:VanZ family protein [Candidatus Azambacteria bacterium]
MYFLKHWLPVFLWFIFIFYLSSIPNLKSGFEEDFILRKFAHFFEYFILSALLFNAILNTAQKRPNFRSAAFLSFLFSVLYAASDEFHQTFVVGRHGDIKDVFLDSLGVISGIFAFYKFKLISRAKDEQEQNK